MRETPAPSWTDIMAMMNAMAPRPAPSQPPERESSVSKWVMGVIASLVVVFLGGLGNYAGSSIAGVGSIGPKLDALAGRFDDLKKSVDVLNQQSSQQQLAIGKQDLRLSLVEQNQARLMDRVRPVDGGPRINAPAPGAFGAP